MASCPGASRSGPSPTLGDPGRFILFLPLGFSIHKMKFGSDCLLGPLVALTLLPAFSLLTREGSSNKWRLKSNLRPALGLPPHPHHLLLALPQTLRLLSPGDHQVTGFSSSGSQSAQGPPLREAPKEPVQSRNNPNPSVLLFPPQSFSPSHIVLLAELLILVMSFLTRIFHGHRACVYSFGCFVSSTFTQCLAHSAWVR